MPMRARAARIGYDEYEEEKEETTGATEGTIGASTFLCNSCQTFLRNFFFSGSRDQSRQDNTIRLTTLRRIGTSAF